VDYRNKMAPDKTREMEIITCPAAPTWAIVFAKGSYGNADGLNNLQTIDVGSANFLSTFLASPNRIAKRLCSGCAATHQEVYYKRITNTASYNPYAVLIDAWLQTDNSLNTDFELYSTYEDAIDGQNKWNYCNYHATVAFPRDCGPTIAVGSQWATRTGGQLNIEWSIEPAN
jgi:hypothetical protein